MSNFPHASKGTVRALANATSQAATVTGAALNIAALDWEGQVEITQNIGAVTGSIAGTIEESADGSTGWLAVPGAAFTTVTAANDTQRIVIQAGATRGWIRYVGTIVTGPVLTAVTASAIPKNVG
jgi:hypothetical protein